MEEKKEFRLKKGMFLLIASLALLAITACNNNTLDETDLEIETTTEDITLTEPAIETTTEDAELMDYISTKDPELYSIIEKGKVLESFDIKIKSGDALTEAEIEDYRYRITDYLLYLKLYVINSNKTAESGLPHLYDEGSDEYNYYMELLSSNFLSTLEDFDKWETSLYEHFPNVFVNNSIDMVEYEEVKQSIDEFIRYTQIQVEGAAEARRFRNQQ